MDNPIYTFNFFKNYELEKISSEIVSISIQAAK